MVQIAWSLRNEQLPLALRLVSGAELVPPNEYCVSNRNSNRKPTSTHSPQTLVVRFVSHKSLWVGLVEAVAELDALLSLAAHALAPPDGGPMCRPELVPGERGAEYQV